ncbi:alpha/beta fold hydrolase [Pararobbsia silviterrae]|uniref:Alpha/beta hydrolase n=1 Tax=Pararobbsia silviterrae TaxID=1792498 RepID=A0A494X2T1_9BURK|nr:alpha/beta hydrolase [Pararobbsia silviterrae]RKP45005.1 alpha/beta hydrolase [Pararobbsia silviterrae]
MSAAGETLQPRERSVQCASPAGLHRTAYTEWGDPGNPNVLLCVHGLTRSGRDFDVLAQALSRDYRVVCPDIVGRGRSGRLADSRYYAVPQYVSDMVTLIARLNVERVDWFGTSMGGLIGMTLAGLPDTPIARMLINDVGPRLGVEAIQRIGDYLGRPVRFDTEQQAIDYLWQISQSFGPHTPEQWRALSLPLLREQDGGWTLRYDPRIADPFKAITPEQAEFGEAMLWRSIETFDGPLLVVRGAQSDLLSSDTANEIVARARHASVVEIPGVGHAPTFVDPAQIEIARAFFIGR